MHQLEHLVGCLTKSLLSNSSAGKLNVCRHENAEKSELMEFRKTSVAFLELPRYWKDYRFHIDNNLDS